MRFVLSFLFILLAAGLVVPVAFPSVDLWVSGLFYHPGDGFFLNNAPLLMALHWLAYDGARVMGAAFAVGVVVAWRRQVFCGLDVKAWVFLLAALLIAPGLIANVGFKDHWGRARPREVTEFGGTAIFSPALIPQAEPRRNGSFVSGDGAFGFFLPVFAYVVPLRLARRVFAASLVAGCAFGGARLLMGAHFLSDIACAAALMLVSVAAVHAAFYGRMVTARRWRIFLGIPHPS